MPIFITGIDTNIGKTLVSAWICLKAGFSYFKPIQAGTLPETDTEAVKRLSGACTYPESFVLKLPASPHLAAAAENKRIDCESIKLPQKDRLVVEGAGGALVPLNETQLMADVMQNFQLPTLVVTHSKLGTFNKTLLTLEALRRRDIGVLGLVVSGPFDPQTLETFEHYGRVPVLGHLPLLRTLDRKALEAVPLSPKLKKALYDTPKRNILQA
ncbi:MAG: dethiobiotin synthase [Holosporaceae bacterium]